MGLAPPSAGAGQNFTELGGPTPAGAKWTPFPGAGGFEVSALPETSSRCSLMTFAFFVCRARKSPGPAPALELSASAGSAYQRHAAAGLPSSRPIRPRLSGRNHSRPALESDGPEINWPRPVFDYGIVLIASLQCGFLYRLKPAAGVAVEEVARSISRRYVRGWLNRSPPSRAAPRQSWAAGRPRKKALITAITAFWEVAPWSPPPVEQLPVRCCTFRKLHQ